MGISLRSRTATAKFSEGYNCAQAVLFAFHDLLNLEADAALKLACGFGAGMGRHQEVCGAVTGGILVIGAKYGRGENQPRAVTEAAYKKTSELMERFAGIHGTFICRQLLNGCVLKTDAGQKQFKADDLLNRTCKPCVQSVVEILEEIL